jgi:prepilin-type processing-associated H-X9-DG protein
VIEGGDAVTWTKPDDFVINADTKKPLPDMKFNGRSRINVALADGSVRTIDLNVVKESTLRDAINPADGNVLGPDW